MKPETKELLEELIIETSAAFLATLDDNNHPFIRAVFNLRCVEKYPKPAKVIKEYDSNPYNVYISTNTASVKTKQILENNDVAVYYSIPEEFKGIMLQGKAEIVEDIDFKEKIWVDGWEVFYPKGFTDPDFTMIKVEPKLLRGWYKGPHIHEF